MMGVSDLRFSLLLSLVYFLPNLFNPFMFLAVPVALVDPKAVDPGFVRQIYLETIMFGVSSILIYLSLRISVLRKNLSRLMSYIFLVPFLVIGKIIFEIIYGWVVNFPRDEKLYSDFAITLLVLLAWIVALFYYILIRRRIFGKLKR